MKPVQRGVLYVEAKKVIKESGPERFTAGVRLVSLGFL
jgi:hypothetical protein